MPNKNIKIETSTIKPIKSSDLTGVMILAFGVAAVLGMGIYATIRYFKAENVYSGISVDTPESVKEAILRDKKFLEQKLPPQSKIIIPAENQIKGSWKINFGVSGVAVLFIGDQKFRLIVTTDPKGALRSYSIGKSVYNEKTGKLSLLPSASEKPDAIKGVQYKVLTQRPYDFYLSQERGNPLLYCSAPQDDIAGKTYHPLFLQVDYTGAPVLKWQKAE